MAGANTYFISTPLAWHPKKGPADEEVDVSKKTLNIEATTNVMGRNTVGRFARGAFLSIIQSSATWGRP